MCDDVYFAFQKLYKLTGKYEYVLTNSKGNPVHPRNMDRTFREILVRCGFGEIPAGGGKTISKIYGVHSLRHSFATYLINDKHANINIVSKWLGHKDIMVTINTYTHTTNKDLEELAKLI